MSAPANKQPRKRKTKAEKEAELAAKQAEAAKPLDARFWFAVGGALLFVGLCVYFDPVNFGDSPQTRDNLLVFFIQAMIAALGKNPVAFGFGGLGLVLIGMGLRTWITNRRA